MNAQINFSASETLNMFRSSALSKMEECFSDSSPDSRRFSIVSDLSWTRWYLDSDLSRTWSSDSPNVQVGLDRVQQYMLFFVFQNKDSLVPQMGNVIAIGLTPSRTGIVIGPSRTGIVIGPLLNAQLRHMSVRCVEA